MTRLQVLKAMLAVHRWLGIAIGLVLLVITLSGIAVTFRPEIERHVLAPELWRETAPPPALDFLALAAAVRAQRPDVSEIAVSAPRLARTRPSASYERANPATGELEFIVAAIDPRSGRIVGEYVYGGLPITAANFMSLVSTLHYGLYLGSAGELLVGFTGLVLAVGVLTGLYVWWPPSRRALRAALTVNWRLSRQRVETSLHRVTGAYATLLVLLLGATGAMLIFPDQTRAIFGGRGVGASPSPATRLAAQADEVQRAIEARFADARLVRVSVPASIEEPVAFQLVREPDPSELIARTRVDWDRRSGTVALVSAPEMESVADTVQAYVHPLHTGEALGTIGRIALAIAGIAMVVLVYTGYSTWARRTFARATATAGRSRATAS